MKIIKKNTHTKKKKNGKSLRTIELKRCWKMNGNEKIEIKIVEPAKSRVSPLNGESIFPNLHCVRAFKNLPFQIGCVYLRAARACEFSIRHTHTFCVAFLSVLQILSKWTL